MKRDAVRYFVTCAKGLEEAVAAELRSPEIGAGHVETGSSGVGFRGGPAHGYRANLWLRSGIRVLAEFARQAVAGPEELYEWAMTLDWPRYLRAEQTFSVEARVRDSNIRHSKYAALRVKDALCDRFRAKSGRRPNVDPVGADLPLFLSLYRNQAVLYRDLSGRTLHKRGYRAALHKSSLNECVAAGILRLSGWAGRRDKPPLADPMCGSGTFAIEAALIALHRAPGLMRKRFPFESWPDFERALWRDCKERARAEARSKLPAPILANDYHPGACALAMRDAKAAGVAEFIRFSQQDVSAYEAPVKPEFVLVNPPWGERLRNEALAESWRKLGRFLKRRATGAEAWVLSGNPALTRHLGLRAAQKFPLKLGKVDCRLLKYEIRAD